MEKNKILMAIVGLIIILGLTVYYFNNRVIYEERVFKEYEEGEHFSSGFNNSFIFAKNKGDYIEYKVENIGNGDIIIRINNGDEKTIEPDSFGVLNYKIKKSKEKIIFKAYSANDKVKIKYTIKQTS